MSATRSVGLAKNSKGIGLDTLSHFLPPRHLRMLLQQRRDRLGRAAGEAAFGGDAEIGRDPFGGGDATAGAGDPAGHVDQAEIELAARLQPEPGVPYRCA